MSLILVFVAVLVAAAVWWLVQQTVNVQPWVTQGPAEDLHRNVLITRPPAKLGLWVLLAVVTSLFAIFIGVYAMRMHLGDWSSVPKPKFLWVNTGVLVLTSVVMQRARSAAVQGQIDGVRNGLILGGALTALFLVGQLVVWRQMYDLGYFLTTNPASTFFYLLTAVHAVHLVGGLVAWGRTTAKMWGGGEKTDQLRLSVELCTTYWDYLLIVWLVLFALLLQT